MKILLLGSGAREHALARALARDPQTSELIVAPGNPGTSAIATNLNIDPCAPEEVVALATQMEADLVVVGPEAPLVAGVADAVRGPALDFCLLVTQRRHREDVALTVEGAAADEWLDIAQAFAGPPGSGRRAGQFAR